MTIDEHIEAEKRIAEEFLDESQTTRAGAVVSHMYEELYYAHMERADLLEQLKTLRKAYELACKNCFGCWDAYENQIDCSDKSCVECFKEYYLQKARENNENKA